MNVSYNIAAQKSKNSARKNAKAAAAQLCEMKPKKNAKKVENGVEATLTYYDFPYEH